MFGRLPATFGGTACGPFFPYEFAAMKHSLFALLLLSTAAARATEPVEALLAQCAIDAHSDTGRNFLKENNSQADPSAAYRNWLLLCMKAKAFAYSPKRCPPAKDGSLQASEARCYERM